MDADLRVEKTGDFVVATLRGLPTESMLIDCQQQIQRLLGAGALGRVLYDARAMEAPPVRVPWLQRQLDEDAPATMHLRRAIVVSNTKIGFLARLAFGGGDYRVFYDDVQAATNWLAAD